MTERVLVCILAKTRAYDVSYASFRRQVLDELGADLALALTVDDNYDRDNPYWAHARYRWTAPDPLDYGQVFDQAQRQLCRQRGTVPKDWRSLLKIRGAWAGRIQSSPPHPSASSILIFSRWLLLQNLISDAVLDRYDRFVITRSDFLWLCPHPPLSILDRQHIWVPDDHHWSGINDRHAIVSREHVISFLDGLEDILLRPDDLMLDLARRDEWNEEQLLALHLQRAGVLQKVREFPYVMYAARSANDLSATWARGRYEPSVGHYVKYESEFRSARALASMIRSRADWEQGRWKGVDVRNIPEPSYSLRERFAHGLDRIRAGVKDQISRPGLLRRGALKWQRLGRKGSAQGSVPVTPQQYDDLSRRRAF